MNKRDLVSLHNAIVALEGRQFNVKFSYFIAKNKIFIKDEIEALNEAKKPPVGFVAYDNKRVELARKYADRDQNGNVKIEDNNFVITENFDKFRVELEKLKEKYKDPIAEYEAQIKEFEDLLKLR